MRNNQPHLDSTKDTLLSSYKSLDAVSPNDLPGSIRPKKFVLHVDADAFFASVEQALRPELKGLAVIVGGTDRGVVTAASYEARKYGVHSAMPVVQAKRLCPHGVFLKPTFEAYKQFSDRMFAIMKAYSPLVETTSIDEGYVDLTGTFRLHNAPPWEIADIMLREIRSTLDINASGGLAGSKIEAKMATSLAKPNGLLYLEPNKASVILGALPVQAVPGVGKRASELLKQHGIYTIGDIAKTSRSHMKSILGHWGEKLLEFATGNTFGEVRSQPRECRKSYSKARTLAVDTQDYGSVRHLARKLAEKLAARLREDKIGACTITLKVRYSDFKESSRSMSLREPTDVNARILWCLDELFWKTVTRRTRIRQIGVKLSGIDQPGVQGNLFDPSLPKRQCLDRAVDTIRNKYGFDSVKALG